MTETSMPKEKIKFLLLEGIHKRAVETLEAAGYTNVEYHSGAMDREELIKRIPEFHFIGIRSRTKLDKEVLKHAKKLIGIGAFCIGTNQIDLKTAMLQGIAVFNAPFSNTRSVAELVLAEIIMLLRRIPERSVMAHKGIWLKDARNSYEVRGKTLGIIGYGNIGKQLSILAESIGMRVQFYDIAPTLPLGNAKRVSSLAYLLKTSDAVSLHVPETDKTRNMIGEREIALMKKNAILINASRGSVVDNEALAEALKKGRLLGAAIDVHPKEPKSKDERFTSPLQGLTNVILTPHVGGSTEEAQESIGEEVAQKLINYSDTGSTVGSVNFPQVSLTTHPKTHKLLHIHKNIPGILTAINNIFSENKINIAAQYLKTNEYIGYVVIHVDKAYGNLALKKIREIPGTIKARILY